MNKKEYKPLSGKAQKDKYGVFFECGAVESALRGLLDKLDNSGIETTCDFFDEIFEEWFPDIMKEGC